MAAFSWSDRLPTVTIFGFPLLIASEQGWQQTILIGCWPGLVMVLVKWRASSASGCPTMHFPPSDVDRMELMVTEAASNAVRHTDVRPEGTPWLHTTEVDH